MADNVTDKGADGPSEPEPISAAPQTPAEPSSDANVLDTGPKPVGSVPRSARLGSHASEWTVSDTRGPLVEASEFPESEVEEPVDPAHAPPVDPRPAPGVAGAAPPIETNPVSATRKSSVWPIAAGLVVGAIIGAGSALIYVATTTSASDVDKQIAALSSRVDGVQARPDLEPTVRGLKSSLAGLEARVGTIQKPPVGQPKSDGTGKARTDSAQPAIGSASPAFDPAPLTRQIAALQASVDALRKRDDDAQAQVTALRKQAADAQQGVASLGAEQKTLAAKVTNSPALAVVADSLVARIVQGGPYVAQVEALASIGADPARIAVLKENADKGVLPAKALAASFEPLADPIVATEHHAAAADASFLDKLKSGMSGLVSIRAVGETTGDSLASKVSAIDADLAHDDVPAAYATWNALPPAAKAKSEAWGAQAKSSAEALTAARALQTQAIAALSAEKP